MALLLAGFAGFVLGVALILYGRALVARSVAHARGLGSDALKPFLGWLEEVIRTQWPILTGDASKPGERVAAAGSILAALSIVAIVGGTVLAATGH